MMSQERFVSHGETVYAFGDETLVVCPRCERRAVVRRITDRPSSPLDYRLVCAHCGYTTEFSFFTDFLPPRTREGLRLWLETPCCGQTLRARNAAHLEYLERYVRAELRERRPDPRWGWSNRSLVSRLPRWISSAKNRDEVLRGIERLKQRLETS